MKTSRRQFIKSGTITAAGIICGGKLFADSTRDYTYLSISDISALLQQRKVSSVAITKACLERIRIMNPKVNAFITVMGKRALSSARKADREIRQGKWRGALHGVPIALKDNIDTQGVKTTAASAVYKDRIPAEDAEVVKQLTHAGAVIIGKTNLHEFAMGTTSLIGYYGSVLNPWNSSYIAGGSSSGSAVAVATGMCYASIGTDTGGSNRLPASCNNIVGFKPSYNCISIKGIIPVVPSIDHAGIFTRTVGDSALVLHGITSQGLPECIVEKFKDSSQKMSIGIVQDYKASDEIKAIFLKAVSIIQAAGFNTKQAKMPKVPADFMMGENEIRDYHLPLISNHRTLYQPDTMKDLDSIPKISADEYQKQKLRLFNDREAISEMLFRDVDVIILPTVAEVTLTVKEAMVKGPFALDDANTFSFNYYGLPAISIPCGFDAQGLPVGLQIVGPKHGEAKVLYVANRFEQLINLHIKHPPLS